MAETRPIVLSPLKGIDQRWTAAAPAAQVVRDMWYDPRGSWSSSGGYKRIIRGPPIQNTPDYLSPFSTIGPVESIHWFSQHSGARRWLIYVADGNLYAFNPSTAARSGSPGDVAVDRANNTITLTTVQTPWQRCQSACWGNWFYLVNGIDRPLVFDGYTWDYCGFTKPAGSVSSVVMASPHMDAEGGSEVSIPNSGLGPSSLIVGENYKVAVRYRVSFVNSRGQESPLSEPSELVYFVNTGGTGVSDAPHAAKVLLPIGPSECVARRIYRTQNVYDSAGILIVGRDTEYFFHSTIPDNASVMLEDVLPDGFLGSAVDPSMLGAFPAGGKFIATYKGRLYVANGNTASVYYSARGKPEVFPVNNEIPFGADKLGPITGMYATRNVLVVFKARKVYLISDDGVNEPLAEPLDGTTGCSAPNTIQEVPGVGIMFLSESGVGILQGTLQNEGVRTQILNAAVPLPYTFRRINRSALVNACAAVYHKDHEYWLCIPTTGYVNNNLVLVYHYELGEWSYRENFPVSSILETADEAGSLLFGSYAATAADSPDGIAHKGIYVYSRGVADKDGAPIEPLYETNTIALGGQFRSFRPKHILVDGVGHGNNTLTMNLASNYSLTNWLSTPMAVIQQYGQEPLPTYGADTYATYDGTIAWQEWNPITMRYDVDSTFQAPVLSLAVRFEPTARYMTLRTISVEVSVDDPVKTLPLKPSGGSA